ncbi:MAG: oligosaccharide repeat unit polymerase [Synergistaceae bacterium]|nr:oligosaccharide repeat unit polymerase [Synergistaceae bacterium]
MGNLLLLMIIYLVYTGLSFWLFNGNFLSPSVVFLVSLSGMLCLAYYAANTMGMLFAIGLRTFSIFAIAGLLFILTELCVYLLRTSSYEEQKPEIKIKHEPLIVNWQIQICVIILFALSLLAAIYVLYVNTSGGSWSARMKEYRGLILNSPNMRYRFIVSQLYKINIVIMDLFGYIMIYNLTVCGVPVKSVLSYIIDALLYTVFCTVYNGARQTGVEAMLFLMMIYVVLNMKPGGRRKIYAFIWKILPVLVLIGGLFTVAGSFVGRVETQKSSFQNFVEYICGGLYFFNRHIDDPHTTHFGQASFAFVYALLYNIGIIPSDDIIMITSEFDIYGNTVTIFGRWYKDFGTTGVFVMTCIVSLIYSFVFYYKLLYSNNINKEHHLMRIYYCQFMTGLIWACYDDRIASLLTLQNIIFLVLVKFFFWLLIEKKFKLF